MNTIELQNAIADVQREANLYDEACNRLALAEQEKKNAEQAYYMRGRVLKDARNTLVAIVERRSA